MTEEQRAAMRAALREVHDRIHALYPRGAETTRSDARNLRDQLLVIDLVVHLADEVIAASEPDTEKIVERTANLLYGIRLVAPGYELEKAAKLLLAGGVDKAAG